MSLRYARDRARPLEVGPKAPQAVIVRRFDWRRWLGGAAIDTFNITAENVAVNNADVFNNDGLITVYISGGSMGQVGLVKCQVTTAEIPARVDERTMQVTVQQR